MTEHRKIICLDFDGVLHSYSSGWQGARNIPDPPTDGALLWLCQAMARFDVAIFSSRSHQFGGRWAMKRWLREHLTAAFVQDTLGGRELVRTWMHLGYQTSMDPWDVECADAARYIVGKIQWPNHKPPAHVTIDDRAFQFQGEWAAYQLDAIEQFKPWNRRS